MSRRSAMDASRSAAPAHAERLTAFYQQSHAFPASARSSIAWTCASRIAIAIKCRSAAKSRACETLKIKTASKKDWTLAFWQRPVFLCGDIAGGADLELISDELGADIIGAARMRLAGHDFKSRGPAHRPDLKLDRIALTNDK